jgi:hypothetical protein
MVAAQAPVAAVFRRGPSPFWLVARWDLATGALEPGAWIHAQLYARRCDLSPDGDLLSYFVLNPRSPDWPRPGSQGAYSAVSRLPWLYALAAWAESGTWTRGHHFVARDAAEAGDVGAPDAGDVGFLRGRLRLVATPAVQYAAERRRGWVEHERCPPRGTNDVWDERRAVVLAKTQPGEQRRLVLEDRGYMPDAGVEGRAPAYSLEQGGREVALPDVAWADWDHAGRLLVATHAGALEMRELRGPSPRTLARHDLAALRPDRKPAPEWARNAERRRG